MIQDGRSKAIHDIYLHQADKPMLSFIKNALLSVLFAVLLSPAYATVYYVAVNGNNANAGTIKKPLATIQKAQDLVSPGDTVYIRGGNYRMSEEQIAQKQGLFANVTYLDKSGTPGKMIHYLAYPGEKPVFDYTDVKPVDQRVIAFQVMGSWLHMKGIEVVGVQVTIKKHTQSECFENHGSNNIFELLSMHDGMAIGFYLLSGSDNLILNCDAYRNFDNFSENGRGGNTDGFGCHPRPGSKGNIFRGCRSWFNSDDGYDVISSGEGTTFDNCWAFYNGYASDFKSAGDGNGFKGGGYGNRRAGPELPDPAPRMTIRFCLAVHNKANGFYSNHHTSGSDWFNNSAYRNGNNFNMLNRLKDNTTDVPGFDHKMRNNLGYKGSKELSNIDMAKNDLSHNYFDMNLDATDDDFISLDETQLTAPRQADGSLPAITFMHLKPNSKFVDKGVDIGFPYKGAAPDLGCFEVKK